MYLSRNCRFISTTNSLNCVPRKSKIVSDKKITPREYHDDKVSETASENPLHFSSTRAILGPRVDALGTGMICICFFVRNPGFEYKSDRPEGQKEIVF